MKQNLLKVLLGVAVIISAACSKDNDPNEVIPNNLPKVVNEAFKKQFPNATNIKWTIKRNFHVASFDIATKSKAAANTGTINEAWYTNEGECGLSELELSQAELEKSYAAVFSAWKATVYVKEGYIIDDIDLLQRTSNANDKVIKIEIEKGNVERDLFFTLNGTLVKDVANVGDEDENLPCPQELTNYVNQHYKGAVIVDFEQDTKTKTYEVEILITQGGIAIEKELNFNDKYEYLGAEIDIDDKVLVELISKLLTPEQIAKIAKITGESDPAEWEIEITENKDGEITISVENTNEQMVPIIKLDKNFKPKQ
ncbi:MAG: hypothetical protein RR735_01265 [Bacteroidales bacterium]